MRNVRINKVLSIECLIILKGETQVHFDEINC